MQGVNSETNNISVSKTEAIPNVRRRDPDLSDYPKYMMGPFHKYLVRRTAIVYIIAAVIGILPWLLNSLGAVNLSPAVQGAALGLVFPGAGLIATGKTAGIILGIVFMLAAATLGNMMIGMAGMFFYGFYLWALGIVGAAFLTDDSPSVYSLILIAVILALYLVKTFNGANKVQKQRLAEREENEKVFPELLKEFKENQVEAQDPEDRELSKEAVYAARYFFDLTLNREVGDFSGYDTADQIQLSALRYSLDYLGYGLATMQCFVTPNFHGYLKEAQEFVIDSLTVPKICGYWKWENLWGNFTWNPDPICHHNIMLSGWSGILPVLYTGNTGDDRYEKENSLKFRPFKNKDKSYDYNNETLVKAIASQWDSLKSSLIPCEPHLVFPWCNGWGFDTVLAYDRIHGTDYVSKAYPKLEKRLTQDWTDANGKLSIAKNTLFGTMALSMGGDFAAASSFAVSRVFNVTDPSLAAKEYILGKKDTFEETDGELKCKIGPWDKLSDIGNFKKGPGHVLGTGAVAAAEMGEGQFVERLLALADELLEKVEDPKRYYYKKTSVTSNASLALARFAQKDDLYHMVHRGPGKNALAGPVLTACRYPEVLVAKARSHTGEDLELVLYDGVSAGDYDLTIERLAAGEKYAVKETGEIFEADLTGKASLRVHIDGRTPLHITPVKSR